MFGLGMGEIVVILVIALIFIGPKKLPELAQGLGKGLKEFQNAMRGISNPSSTEQEHTHNQNSDHSPEISDHHSPDHQTAEQKIEEKNEEITKVSEQNSNGDSVPAQGDIGSSSETENDQAADKNESDTKKA